MIYVFGGQFLGIAQGEGKKYERLSADLRILHRFGAASEVEKGRGGNWKQAGRQADRQHNVHVCMSTLR